MTRREAIAATGFNFKPLPNGNVLIEFFGDDGKTINQQIVTAVARISWRSVLHGRPERKVNAMSEYLTWDCPKCGKSKVRSVCIEETTAWLDQDGYAEDEEKLGDDQYKFLCGGCDTEIRQPDGSTFDEPSDIAEFFRGDEDVDRCDRL